MMRPRLLKHALGATGLLALATLAACSSDDGQADLDGGIAGDAGSENDAAEEACRFSGPDNAARKLVVARPYGEMGAKSNRWELLDLSLTGEITSSDTFFEMGRGLDGRVAFTPDGEIGLVAQEGGSVGVFRIDESGEVEVLHAALEGDFYASEVVMSPAGDRAYIFDGNWRENGGGIYSLKIGCDDSIKSEGLLVSAKLGRLPQWKESGDMIVVANDLGDSTADQDLHLVGAGSMESPLASARVFPDRDAIASSSALTADEKFVLVGDNSAFSGIPNRVGVARVTESGLEAVQLLPDINDPYDMVASPFNDAVLVVSGFGDALLSLDYDPANQATPFVLAGELDYLGEGPALPSNLVMIERGDLLGTVLVAENQGIRRVVFEGEGVVSDKGRTEIGSSYAGIVGAIGVQP
jgi:hypothetical protein